MERKIDEVFEYQGKKLKVMETTRNLCLDCYFYDGVCCQKTDRECGNCDIGKRTDHKSIIFVEVKEGPKERKIGEVFEYEGKKLQVKESDHVSCDGCFFDEHCIPCSKYVAGYCEFGFRADKKEVIFVEATEQNQTEQLQKIDLCEILKDCPKGWILYSPIFGKVHFRKISDDLEYPIVVSVINNKNYYTEERFDKNGCFFIDFNAECLLFPSEELRDWTKFTAPWYKKEEPIKPKFKIGDKIRHKETNKDDVYEISKVYDDSYGIVGFNWGIYMKYQDQYELVPNKFDPKTLKPFDKVLVRDTADFSWACDLFSYILDGDVEYKYKGVGCLNKYCIPYNDDTKHLVGTKGEAPEFYKYWEE